MRSGELAIAVEIPSGFAAMLQTCIARVAFWVDGAMPFRGETTKGYVTAWSSVMRRISLSSASAPMRHQTSILAASMSKSLPLQSGFQEHLRHGSAHYRDGVGSDPGSHDNHRCRPRERNRLDRQLSVHSHQQFEFLVGKLFPYVVVGMRHHYLLLMALFVFHVPVKGSFGALALGTLVYVFSTCGFGQLISTFTQTQVAAVLRPPFSPSSPR